MFVSRYQLIVPRNANLPGHALAADASEHDKIQAYQGTQAVKNYGITVEGSGVFATGSINGTLTTYDYRALYDVYHVDHKVSVDVWFLSYAKDESQDQLVKTFEQSETFTSQYDVAFTIQGNDHGIESVFITFQVIRLVINGVTKDFVVTTPAAAAANNADGTPYQGQFTPKQAAQPARA
jgi:hypothetical protein